MFECRDIRKSFGGIEVLKGVDLLLEQGARIGLSGGNGSGKSTLINIATGFVATDGGDLRLDGQSYQSLPPWQIARLGIRRTFQSVRMQPSAPLSEQLHNPNSDAQTRSKMLQDSGVAAYLDRFPAQAPAPVLRKAEVVRALLAQPRVLFLDEPSAGLDAAELENLGTFVNRWAPPALILVIVEHRRDLMDMTVRQLFELRDGRLSDITAGTRQNRNRNERNMLEVEGLSVHYGAVRALQNVNVRVPKGGAVLLTGHHGAGKSSLLKAIIGAVPCDGEVRIDGSLQRHRKPHLMARRGVVLVPEGRNIFARLSTRENLEFGAAVTGTKSRLNEVVSVFPELQRLLDLPAYALSGGQAQMLAFARGLMAKPNYLLLDEPTLGLAAGPAARVVEQIRQLKARRIGVLMVEQNHGIAEQIADHILDIENGTITQHGAANANGNPHQTQTTQAFST